MTSSGGFSGASTNGDQVRAHASMVGLGVMLHCSFRAALSTARNVGQQIDPWLLAQLQPGLSTKGDILRALGVPSRKSVIQDREAWIYDYSLEEHVGLVFGSV